MSRENCHFDSFAATVGWQSDNRLMNDNPSFHSNREYLRSSKLFSFEYNLIQLFFPLLQKRITMQQVELFRETVFF